MSQLSITVWVPLVVVSNGTQGWIDAECEHA
jgi:hypothetical protein